MRTLFIGDCEPILDVRLQLLRMQFSIETEDFDMAGDLLDHIQTYFTGAVPAIELIHLSNQMHCNLVDRSIVASEMELVKCLRLLQQHQWRWHQMQQQQPRSAFEMVLSHRQCNFDSKYLSVFQQFEMLVEWHWHAEQFANCLYWCEIGLHESIRCWLFEHIINGHELVASTQFSEHIRFLIVYLEHLFDENNRYGRRKYIIIIMILFFSIILL